MVQKLQIVFRVVLLLGLQTCHRPMEPAESTAGDPLRKQRFQQKKSVFISEKKKQDNGVTGTGGTRDLQKTTAVDTPGALPEIVRLPEDSQNEIDDLVLRAVDSGIAPGFVVAIGRKEGIAFLRAYGKKSILPDPRWMTADTVFDLASITKPLVTATSIMILWEQGKLSLDDPVARHIEKFGVCKKNSVTIRHLLLHTGGLPAVNRLSEYSGGRADAVSRIFSICPKRKPGAKVVYSDLGFIVLGEVVSRVSGMPLDEFAHKHIFLPLGMTETGYLPSKPLKKRAAPTEKRDDVWIVGDVHDPRAWRLGGVSGNAGVFSTAADLARFCRMMLSGGGLNRARILTQKTIDTMTAPYPVPDDKVRGLGWWLRPNTLSKKHGLELPRRFGHGGFTGTGIWMDPAKNLFAIVLSNRVHPDGRTKSLTALENRIYDIAEKALPLIVPPVQDETGVLLGIDVLRKSSFRALEGARVGLITNASGRARDGMLTRDLLMKTPKVELVALFGPEHGFAAREEGRIRTTRDKVTGLPIFSLFGPNRKPTLESLKGVDTLVFDLQDVGVRYYTYMSTMLRVMETAGERGLRFVILDRPNPLGGVEVEGPVLDEKLTTFVNYHPLPIRHGMTAAELARLLKEQKKLPLNIEIVPMEGWKRSQSWQETGLCWYRPSPNIRTPTQNLLYASLGLFEGTNVTVGRGTARPFEIVAAPWMKSAKMIHLLKMMELPGAQFSPVRVVPGKSRYRGKTCFGVRVEITDREIFRPVRVGLGIAKAINRLYPKIWKSEKMVQLVGDKRVFEAVLKGDHLDKIVALWQKKLGKFKEERKKHLLYR